ncbi:hypothetical protein OAK90_01280 [bacterium]|nr:hypothetical protein [bacterium]
MTRTFTNGGESFATGVAVSWFSVTGDGLQSIIMNLVSQPSAYRHPRHFKRISDLLPRLALFIDIIILKGYY